jgi:hypothetical protein
MNITWELLPEDFILDDEPVDNVNQPPIAAVLTESLELAGRLLNNFISNQNLDVGLKVYLNSSRINLFLHL